MKTFELGYIFPIALLLLFLFTGLFVTRPLSAQDTQNRDSVPVYVNNQGVMKWSKSDDEVSLFGVNYYTPFSQTYRGLNVMKRNHKKAIDEDIYHIARLGLDAFRTHLYDIEITDSLGNLLQNHHLDLHDYTVHKMNQHGIKTILTPTTYYGAGWPDGNVVQPPGFSNYITKGGAPQNRDYWSVIMNYLEQLINHRNPYTGMTAIEDPNIIALEIDNEPSHSGAERTQEFINTLADHLRESGWEKPIFYNISHNFDVTDAKLDARIDGVTFQWYPAGLYEGVEKRSNYFPYVNNYTVPFQDEENYRSKAKMVYEFDPADNLNNYALPMSARGFREAGFQFAAHFAYTALGVAHMNTDWRSHYLNLVYTPGRAVSMLIAGEVFRKTDLGEQFNDFPADTAFGDFLMSHHLDLSQMNSEEVFLHSNETATSPENEKTLKRIAGVGSSPVVTYPGTGAYFLDKLEDGIWRLEVMPDAMRVRDPFEPPAFDKYVTHINWRQHPMQIQLHDLGESFSVEGLNEGNSVNTKASDGSFSISPGAYLLSRDGKSGDNWEPESRMGTIQIGEYHAVGPTADEPVAHHRPLENVEAGKAVTITADIAGLTSDDTVLLRISPYVGQSRNFRMKEVRPYRYEVKIPAEAVNEGILRYWIVIDRGNNEFITFPNSNSSAPWRWNFYKQDEHWMTQVVDSDSPLEIWNAEKDHLNTFEGFSSFGEGSNQSNLIATDQPDRMARSISTTSPTTHRHVLGLSTYIRDKVKGINKAAMKSYQDLIIRAKTEYNLPAPLKVILVDTDGNSYSARVPVTDSWQEHRIPLSSFEPDRFMLLPRAYPSILDSWYATGVQGPVRTNKIEEIQFYVDTSGVTGLDGIDRYGYEMQSVWLD